MDYVLPPSPLIQGLCVPMVTAFDENGAFDASAQERLVAYLVLGESGGGGAQALFTNGTSGEWTRLEPKTRLQVTETVHYALARGRGPGLWAGVSDRFSECVALNLEHALKLGVAAAVVAPLAIEDAEDACSVFHRQISPLFQRMGRGLPVFLYDNPDAYHRGPQDRLRTEEVKQLARLDYVCGVKVSADASTAGNYLKGARNFKSRHEFGVYLGQALQAFRLFEPDRGMLGRLRGRWRRFWVAAEAPQGIVPLSANLFPGAWRRAWVACQAGDLERMEAYRVVLSRLHAAFRVGGVHKGIACVKEALLEEGVLRCARLADGTPALTADERYRWMLEYAKAKRELGVLGRPRNMAPSPPPLYVAGTPEPRAVPPSSEEVYIMEGSAETYLRVALSEIEVIAKTCPLDTIGKACGLILDAESAGCRVHVTGVGKCEYVAGFIASSFSSTGTPAFFLHATEAGHGASGQVGAGDIVIAISNSGETGELKAAVDTLQRNGARILGVGGKPESWLARRSEVYLWAGVRREGDDLGLAPRNSVLAEILVLNAVGVALQHQKKFTAAQFRAYHPGGSLGRGGRD